MKFKFPSIEKYLKKDDLVLSSNEKSKVYINIPELMGKHGAGLMHSLKMRLPVIPKMIGCMYESLKSASTIVENPKLRKTCMSRKELSDLTDYIQSLNIDKIGFTEVPPELIFKDHTILYRYAIVLVMEMKKEPMATAPSVDALKEVFRTYYDLGVTVNQIAHYLRERGYNAMAGPAIGGDVNYVPLAEKAGLGVIGKHGLLITEDAYGPSLRLATVYTDVENLPLFQTNNHLWIKDFCNHCKKCVKACPAGAIYEETLPEGRCIDQDKCAKPFSTEYGCSVCIKSCTFFNTPYDVVKTRFERSKKKKCE